MIQVALVLLGLAATSGARRVKTPAENSPGADGKAAEATRALAQLLLLEIKSAAAFSPSGPAHLRVGSPPVVTSKPVVRKQSRRGRICCKPVMIPPQALGAKQPAHDQQKSDNEEENPPATWQAYDQHPDDPSVSCYISEDEDEENVPEAWICADDEDLKTEGGSGDAEDSY
mmetsp:Transcript_126175/g.223534  ORF Transcript_126175/g.223534 Transcript_126175/m.223534 type:complete len:172 (-) Transcript_126175:190-705(-)